MHRTVKMMKDKLVSRDYCAILAANFLLYSGFFLLMPVLPFYLVEEFGTERGMIGVILSAYTVAALVVRPFSGYLLDTFRRKPLYLFAFFVFTLIFGGYIVAGSLAVFVMLRIVHGLSFGTVTVAGNTIVIDITPSSRRGEALGYYGLANNVAMALGPMAGLFMHDYYSFDTIFVTALVCCTLGFCFAMTVRTPAKPLMQKDPHISLDRFILLRGIPLGIDLLLLSIPYGINTTYVAMYAKSIGLTQGTGIFFTCMAAGLAISRLFSGRRVDKGRITQTVILGMYLATAAFLGLYLCEGLMHHFPEFTKYLFYALAVVLGVGFGSMFPAFNTMFVNLADHNQRGTATSTYLTSWDVGIGLGLITGGIIGQVASFSYAYLTGTFLCIVSFLFFKYYNVPYFEKYRKR